MSTVNLKLYDFAKREFHLTDEKAREFVGAIDEMVIEDIKANTSEFKSIFKDDFFTLERKINDSKMDMYKALFVTSIVQLIAILGGVMVIVKQMTGK